MHLDGRLDAVVESDIVGYTTITMEAGKWYQVGCPFVALDGDATKVSLNVAFKGDFSRGDVMNVLDTASGRYTPYYWNPNATGGPAWVEMSAYNPAPTTASFDNGTAVYISKAKGTNSVTLTLTGKVVATEVEFGLESGNAWSQVIAVWPETIGINDIEWTNLTREDSMNILDSENNRYDTYYWNPNATGGPAWVEMSVYNPTPSTRTINPGQGMYINKKSTGSLGKLRAE